MNQNRRNALILASAAVVLLALGIGYLLFASNRVDRDLAAREQRALENIAQREPTRPTATPRELASVPANEETATTTEAAGPVPQPGEVVVVNRVPGDDYGRLAIRHTDGSRTLLDRRCMRIHIAAGNGVCLSGDAGLVASYTATFFDAEDPSQRDIKSYAVPLPSRAQVSSDGSLATTTSFIAGTTYEDITGETSTVVTIDAFDNNNLMGVNQFDVDAGDDRYFNENRKFWGLSFVDNNDFYITGLFGDEPEILRGSVEDRTVTPTGLEGSCPSLSPDLKTLVFKQTRTGGGFDLVALDIETGDVTLLAETRSVDDQVEWLDNDTILYALHPDDEEQLVQPEFDIWMLDITEGSEPELFMLNADSPAVIS